MKSFFYEFNLAAKQAPRMYFAPLVGAVKAIKAELRPRKPQEKKQKQAAQAPAQG